MCVNAVLGVNGGSWWVREGLMGLRYAERWVGGEYTNTYISPQDHSQETDVCRFRVWWGVPLTLAQRVSDQRENKDLPHFLSIAILQ